DLKLLQALERKRIKLVIESSIEHLRVMLGNGQQHVRLAHNAARGKIVLAPEHDPALPPGTIQFCVHQTGPETTRRNKNMVLPEICVQIELTPNGRMSLARHHNYAIGKQRLLAEIVTDGYGYIQNQIQSPAGQFLF